MEVSKENRIVKCKIQVVKVLYESQTNDFKIFKAKVVEGYENYPLPLNEYNFSVKGEAPDLSCYGIIYVLEAEEYFDDKYGWSYKIISIREDWNIEDVDSQKRLLRNILTNKEYVALFTAFDNPLKAILKDGKIDEVKKVKGIGPVTIDKIRKKIDDNQDYGSIYLKLNIDIPKSLIKSLLKKYSSPDLIVQKIKDNPYILSSEVKGIGFKKADEIALKMGIDKKDPKRIQAYIKYFLTEIENRDGHLWIVLSDLVYNVKNYIDNGITVEEIVQNIKKLIELKILFYDKEEKKIGLYSYYKLEKNICTEIIRLQRNKVSCPENWQQSIKNLEKIQGWEFNEEQYLAIETVLKNPITIITGAGGTGKTSTVAGILYALPNCIFAQCALSGKAANRLQEVTNFEGKTIHRLLSFTETGFGYNKTHPLECDMILLDEGSMVGGDIFLKLLEAIRDGSRLVILGDVNQLDAIGLGCSFKDMIASNVVPVINLKKIMRQAAKSGIITESLKISKSIQITDNTFNGEKTFGELQDFTIHCDKKSNILIEIANCYKKYIKEVDSILNLQFITPLKSRGEINTKNINTLIQKLYNPENKGKNEVLLSSIKDKTNGYILREGDKVINRKNNYSIYDIDDKKTCIYNGNIGIIEEIRYNDMIINFDGIGRIIIPKDWYKNIELAYCITCHLSQGSQFDYVVYTFDMGAYILLNKEQVYTGISRAIKHCDLYAPNDALRQAIRTSKSVIKQTWLKDLLKKEFNNEGNCN